jgi:signal transduction histidine kinase
MGSSLRKSRVHTSPAESQLRRSQKTFSDVVERSPFGVYVVDSNFRIAQMNGRSQKGAFRNVRPVIGRDFSEAMRILWPEPVAQEIIAVFRQTLETGEPYYSPGFTNARLDVAVTESYEWELHRITLPDGQKGVICYYFDSTRLRQAEEATRQSEARYRELAENLDRQVQARTTELQLRNEQMLRAAEDLRELSGRVLRVQDEERRRIARELHDSAGQVLTAIGLELGSLAEDIHKIAPPLESRMAVAEELVQQLHREIRTTSYLLHPPLLDEAGLSSALSWYTEGLSQRSGIQIRLDVPEDFGRLPRDMELVMFRLVQESMTNIHRHSESTTAEIRIARESGGVTIEVQDHGKGMSEEDLRKLREGGSGIGVGLRGMRERLRQFRGDLKIESNGSGTRVLVRIPAPQDTVAEFAQPLQPAV